MVATNVIERWVQRVQLWDPVNGFARNPPAVRGYETFEQGFQLMRHNDHPPHQAEVVATFVPPRLVVIDATYSPITASYIQAYVEHARIPFARISHLALTRLGVTLPNMGIVATHNVSHGYNVYEDMYEYVFTAPRTNDPNWRYFISGWDVQEPRPLYFLSLLPQTAEPTTVAEAYEALKPEAVKVAEAAKRSIVRQGDIFAIEVPTVKAADVLSQGEMSVRNVTLLGTNHVASEVMIDGISQPNLVYARGTLIHRPQGRPPDHVPRELGKRSWWLVVRNTVPTN